MHSINKLAPADMASSVPTSAAIDYKFLDGLRGLGALAVYHLHLFNVEAYSLPSKEEYETRTGRGEHLAPNFVRYFHPIRILAAGTAWVYVFFVLSGFVLTIRFFKTRK